MKLIGCVNSIPCNEPEMISNHRRALKFPQSIILGDDSVRMKRHQLHINGTVDDESSAWMGKLYSVEDLNPMKFNSRVTRGRGWQEEVQ